MSLRFQVQTVLKDFFAEMTIGLTVSLAQVTREKKEVRMAKSLHVFMTQRVPGFAVLLLNEI